MDYNSLSKMFKLEDYQELHNSLILDCDIIIKTLDIVLEELCDGSDEYIYNYNNQSNANCVKREILSYLNEDAVTHPNISVIDGWMRQFIPKDFYDGQDKYFNFKYTKNTYMEICSKYSSE